MPAYTVAHDLARETKDDDSSDASAPARDPARLESSFKDGRTDDDNIALPPACFGPTKAPNETPILQVAQQQRVPLVLRSLKHGYSIFDSEGRSNTTTLQLCLTFLDS
jgi:hypothetical protein